MSNKKKRKKKKKRPSGEATGGTHSGAQVPQELFLHILKDTAALLLHEDRVRSPA